MFQLEDKQNSVLLSFKPCLSAGKQGRIIYEKVEQKPVTLLGKNIRTQDKCKEGAQGN